MISLTDYDYSEGEQWGRYNVPSLMNQFWPSLPLILLLRTMSEAKFSSKKTTGVANNEDI